MKVLIFWAIICLNFIAFSQDLDTVAFHDNFKNSDPIRAKEETSISEGSSGKPIWHLKKFSGDEGEVVTMLPEKELLLFVEGQPGAPVLKVFLDNIEVGELTDLNDGYYSFSIPNEIKDKKLPELLALRDEHQSHVKLYVGQSLSSRVQILSKDVDDGKFLLIIDEYRQARVWFSVVAIVLILLFLVLAMNKGGLEFLRDDIGSKRMPAGFTAPYSLSKTQFAFWTIVVLFCFFYVWILKGTTIEITGNVLALLGISAGTNLGGKLLDQKDIRDPQIRHRHQEDNDTNSFILNIISDEHGISLHRFQNVIFSLAIASYLIFSVINEKQFPELDGGLMTLMGISSGTYLALKSKENTPTKTAPVG